MTLKAKISINRLVQMHDIRDPNFFKYKEAMDGFFGHYEEMAKEHGVSLSTEYGGNKEGIFFVIHDTKSVDLIDVEGDNIIEFLATKEALTNFEKRSDEFLEDFIAEHPVFEQFEFSPVMWRMFVY